VALDFPFEIFIGLCLDLDSVLKILDGSGISKYNSPLIVAAQGKYACRCRGACGGKDVSPKCLISEKIISISNMNKNFVSKLQACLKFFS